MADFDLERIKQISPHDLESAGLIQKSPRGSRKDGHGYCCVYCSSGTGQNQSGGLDFDYRGDAWVHTCRSCGNGGDNIKFFQHVFNAGFADACRQASEMFGIPIAESNNFGGVTYRRPTAPLPKPAATTPTKLKLPEKTLPEQVPLIRNDIAQAQEMLQQLPEDQRRGLLLETLQYFNCGFAPRWVHPVCRLDGNKPKIPTPRIIIPTDDGEHYLALALDRDRKLDPKNSFHKAHAGAKTQVFNAADLRHETIIVVEGEVDAMSIFQSYTSTTDADVGVVATLSAGGWKNLIVAQIDNGLFAWHKFIILFDNDDAGHKTAEEFKTELEKRGCPAVIKFLDDYVSLPFINNSLLPKTKEQLANSKIDANAMLKICGRLNLAYALSHIFSDANKEFGDIHNQRTLDFNAAPVETTPPAAVTPAVVEQTADTSANIFDEWQELNGKINPDVVQKILDAHNYLGGIKADNLTPDIVQSSKLKHALALCTFYDTFSNDVSKFFATLGKVRKAAKDNLQLVANGLATEDENAHAWEIFSVTSFKADIDKIKKQIAKAHKEFTRSENSRIASENNQRRLQAVAEQKLSAEDKLNELRKQPQTPARDAEMIQLIKDMCDWKMTPRGERDAVKATAENINLIFKFDPNISGLFAFEEFQSIITFRKEPLWAQPDTPRTGTEWRDTDDAELRFYLRTTYTEFANDNLVSDAIVAYAYAHAYHEVKEFVAGLPKWDGTPRAETLLIKFLGGVDNRFNRVITMNWLIAAYARLFYPGADYQQCLVITGGQGNGKSRLIEMLGGAYGVNPKGKKWHGSIQEQIGDTHVIDAIQNIWFGELEEGCAVSKADVRALKAFLSTKDDNRRFSYDKRAKRVKRHCIFALTTNEKSFLRDPTGSRRFNVFEGDKRPLQRVQGMTADYIRQVHAEVYAKFCAMFADGFDEAKLRLPHDIEIESERRNLNFMQTDGMEEEFLAWLDKKILPFYIWLLLTPEERARFCSKGQLTMINACDELVRRRRLSGNVRTREDEIQMIRAFCHPYDDETETGNVYCSTTVVLYMGKENLEYTLYGSETRQHVCFSEAYNESFVNDKRKTQKRITELLDALDGNGWYRSDKIFNRDKEYGNQRKVFWRDITVPENENQNTETAKQQDKNSATLPSSTSDADFGGTPIDPQDLPF